MKYFRFSFISERIKKPRTGHFDNFSPSVGDNGVSLTSVPAQKVNGAVTGLAWSADKYFPTVTVVVLSSFVFILARQIFPSLYHG